MNQTLREIVDIIGLQPTIELTRAWGGRALYVPQDMREMHPITLTIGFEAARKLSAAYPAMQIAIPAERNLLLELRNRAICEDFRAGSSVNKLADRYGISRKMVHKVLDRSGLRQSVEAAT